MTEALCRLPENPREPDQGKGRDGEDHDYGSVKKLSDNDSHRERDRCTVGYFAEQYGPLRIFLRITMTIIL